MCALEHIPLVSFFPPQTKGKRLKKAICRLAEGLAVIWFIPHVGCKLTSPLTQRHAWTSRYKQDLFPPLCLNRSHQGGRKALLHAGSTLTLTGLIGVRVGLGLFNTTDLKSIQSFPKRL